VQQLLDHCDGAAQGILVDLPPHVRDAWTIGDAMAASGPSLALTTLEIPSGLALVEQPGRGEPCAVSLFPASAQRRRSDLKIKKIGLACSLRLKCVRVPCPCGLSAGTGSESSSAGM
jgi:hypothetical protein